jgi:hypothetical protein
MPPDFIYSWSATGMFLAILVGVSATALALHIVFFVSPMARLSKAVADLSPVLMTLCGTLFVLNVTFLANSVWQIENDARETVNAEARSLKVIKTYMEAMTGPSRDGFARIIGTYAQAVEAEWPMMTSSAHRAPAESQLKDIYSAAIEGFSAGDQNRTLQQRILASLDQLSNARQQRLSMAQEVVSGGQWFTVTMLGLLLMLVIAICHGRFPLARAVALSAVTMAITVSLFVILAHDRPFVGLNAISPQPILNAARAAN